MKSKIMESAQAVSMIKDGSTITVEGFVGNAHPEELMIALENRYLAAKKPSGLTLIYAAGKGDCKDRGLNHIAHEGLISRVIGGHFGLVPKLQKLIFENKVEAYNLPQGVISALFRDAAAHRPGTITRLGLKTFVDPRLEGGKLNDITKEDIVELIKIKGMDYLFYKSFPVDAAIIRATYADEDGNATMEKEAAPLDALSLALAAKNSGGIVILQVENVVKCGTLDPRKVKIPGILVDAISIAKPENNMQTFAEQYNPSYSGEVKVPVQMIEKQPLDERKVISRRAAMELKRNSIVNLGIGMPEGISYVANEEGIADEMKLTTEAGTIGGVPLGGMNFGAAVNPECIVDQGYQFDFYDGGGLDIAFLGLAQCDKCGNINVSKFGDKIAGCGGFIDITQTSKKVVYCGTFTAGGLKVNISDGKLNIINEGRYKKFINEVEQVTFSGEYAAETKQDVMYITERAVFRLTGIGLELIEIAKGVDLKKDILDLMEFKPSISKNLKYMDDRIFRDEPMGLALK
jgi:propionate CoA-transferase